MLQSVLWYSSLFSTGKKYTRRSTIYYVMLAPLSQPHMELDIHSLFGLLCTAVLIGWDSATTPLPPHLGSYTRALLVSQDRRHLFVTPCMVPTPRLIIIRTEMLRIRTFLAVYDTNLQILYTYPFKARSYPKLMLLFSGTRCGVPEAEIWLRKGALFSRDAHCSFCF